MSEEPREDGSSDPATAPPEDRWPLQDPLEKLESYDLGELEGRRRLGDLAFDDAPAQVREIIEILHELRQEPSERLDDGFINEVASNLNGLTQVLDQMVQLRSSDPSASASRDNFSQQLQNIHSFFRTAVRPRCITARIRDELQAQSPGVAEAGVEKRIEETQRRLSALQERESELAERLQALEPVAEAQREAATASAAGELSADYIKQADDHAKAWKRWGKWLIASVVVAIAGGVTVLLAAHPAKKATNAQIASRLTLDLLVIGLLLYLVRLMSLQFRVHRHLEAVARSKAAALSTFSRMVIGPADAEVRTAVAQIVAQAVFATGETGFIDATGEHVTLIERALGPAIQRMSP